ncbi:hypothetical protein bb8_p28 [Bordetella phage vB_BbrP_BB8]|uniref:Uncharacterized protein n=1 Tax=Bordetella phage vB_BbrP_BB8 TaxID=2587820 RepID=A0A4Y5TPX1_9CAUD|nr:hypothetical protein bb8_p28 [Bordetella phage vB_BbrP_BB8]
MKLPFTQITVESALSGLNKAVADLKTAIEFHQAEADRYGEEASRLVSKSNENIRAAQKAERAHAKLTELLS